MRKLQVNIDDESWSKLESIVKSANEDFKFGTVNFSDVICECIRTARIELDDLRAKHTNVRKSLRSMAARKKIDLNEAIDVLLEIRDRIEKKPVPRGKQVRNGGSLNEESQEIVRSRDQGNLKRA